MTDKAADQVHGIRVGARVLFKTLEARLGQFEHAAVVTRLNSDGTVNLTVFPPDGTPEHVAEVPPVGKAPQHSLSFRPLEA